MFGIYEGIPKHKVWPYCEILIRSRELEDSGAEALGLQHLGGGLVVDT